MAGSLKARLLVRLSLAQALAVALTMVLFPLVTPYVDYAEIADNTARKLLERSLRRQPAGDLQIVPRARLTRYLAERPGFTYAVVDPRTGRAVPGSSPLLSDVAAQFRPFMPLPGTAFNVQDAAGRRAAVETRETEWGVLAFVTAGNAFRLSDLPSFVDVFLPAIGPMFAPLLIGALVAVPLVVGRAMRPLRRAEREAGSIDLRTLGRRLSDAGMPEEFVPLVRSINAALDRLDEGVTRQQRYSANAAHEMRTPLAVLQARIDALPESAHKLALRREVRRAATVVEQFLTVVRLGQHAVAMDETVDLVACVRDIVADLAPLAIQNGRQIAFTATMPRGIVAGNARAVASAVANLIDNALRAEPAGGTVEVSVGPDPASRMPASLVSAGLAPTHVVPSRLVIEVADHGTGLAPEDRERAFEPFWRKDERPPGAGLGLAIVYEVAALHGGEAALGETPGGGLTVRLALPSGAAVMPGRAV